MQIEYEKNVDRKFYREPQILLLLLLLLASPLSKSFGRHYNITPSVSVLHHTLLIFHTRWSQILREYDVPERLKWRSFRCDRTQQQYSDCIRDFVFFFISISPEESLDNDVNVHCDENSDGYDMCTAGQGLHKTAVLTRAEKINNSDRSRVIRFVKPFGPSIESNVDNNGTR